MMKKALLLLLACSLVKSLTAQQPKIEFSEPLTDIKVFQYGEEIQDSKIINSKTGYIDIITIAKFGIHVHVFDAQHKQVAYSRLEQNEYFTMNELALSSTICGIYEIGDKINIFLRQYHKKQIRLIRMVIDPKTGRLENTIHMDALTKSSPPFLQLADRTPEGKEYYVEKDKFSDDYAVVSCDWGKEATPVEVFQFNGAHEQVSRSVLNLADEAHFDYIDIVGLQVVKDKGVYVCTNSYNLRGDNKEQVVNSATYISKLAPGSNAFQSTKIDLQPRIREIKGMLEYNPRLGQIELLTQALENKDYPHNKISLHRKFWTDLTFLHPQSLSIINQKRIETNTLTEYKREASNDKAAFNGFPQDMLIDDDGIKRTIILEDVAETVRRNQGPGFAYANITYKGMGILEFDSSMTLTNTLFADKNITTGDMDIFFNLNRRAKGYAKCAQRNILFNIGYVDNLSFDYIPGVQNKYVVFNDRGDKLSSPFKTMYAKLNGGSRAEYLFGADSDQKVLTASAVYDKTKNTYSALVEEGEGRRLVVKMVWIKFD